MAADALVLYITKASETKVSTKADKQVLVNHKKGLKLGTPLRDWTIRENVNIFCVSPNKFNITVVNMCISVFLPSNIFICCITVFYLTDPQWYSTRNLSRTINVGIFYDMITIINPHCNPTWSYKRLLMVSYKGNISHIFWRTLLSKAT